MSNSVVKDNIDLNDQSKYTINKISDSSINIGLLDEVESFNFIDTVQNVIATATILFKEYKICKESNKIKVAWNQGVTKDHSLVQDFITNLSDLLGCGIVFTSNNELVLI